MNRLPILAALLAAASAPSWAQGAPAWPEPLPYGSNYTPDQLMDQVAAQIDRYARDGLVSRSDAEHWQAQLAGVRALERSYRRGGISDRERIDLVHRTIVIRDQLIAAENRRLGRSVSMRRLPPQEPPFEDNRYRSLIDNDQARRIDNNFPPLSRRSDDGRSYDTDDPRDMNDLRGPAPPKHTEGSGLGDERFRTRPTP